MSISILTKGIENSSQYSSLMSRLLELRNEGKSLPLLVDGVCEGALFPLLYSLVRDIKKATGKGVLVLLGEERQANRLNDSFKKTDMRSELYPVRDFNFYEMTASRDIEHERLKVLLGVALDLTDVVFSTPDALIQYTMPKKTLIENTVFLSKSSTVDILELGKRLYSMGYTPSERVEGPGQYSIRGGIVDIFPTKCEFVCGKETIYEHSPVRIELFGDDIERMVCFDPVTQRKTYEIDSFIISPSREILPSPDSLEKIENTLLSLKGANESASDELARELSTIKYDDSPAFLDRFISLIYEEKECLLDYLSKDLTVIVCDSTAVKNKVSDAQRQSNEVASSLIENGLIPSELSDYSAPVSKIDALLKTHQSIRIDDYILSTLTEVGGIYHFGTKATSFLSSNQEAVLEELKYYVLEGYTTVLACQNETEARSSVKMLNDEGLSAFLAKDGSELISGGVAVIYGGFGSYGYDIPSEKFASVILSERRSVEKKRLDSKRKSKKNAGEKIMSYAELNVGDYVVHANYGVGKYLGIENMCVLGAYRDYVAIQYQGTDKLFLPVDQLDLVSKYIGARSDTGEVKLSNMYGGEWKRAKTKAKQSAKDMARELTQLYARRTRENGFAFMPDGIMEREFDSSFEYEETPSQLQAISEIKADMERPYPMDRVLCGDVGYGKTEVAFRAAMKAVANNKQVAILVPTTILAMQHYQTALARFAGTGVAIDMISRFRTAKEQRATLNRLRRGDLDIIIGTHKLLSSQIEFKDLGLLIVDEEQRFGVSQKEKIKKMAPCVDVLTLSATPIPRTLSMAMGGIRDLSVLDDSPEGRMEIQSYVLEHDENIINDAIKRELHRGGQVFYLYNNVEKIYYIAERLRKAFPSANLAVAHGQMDKDDIEEIWHALVNGNIDILVSTTIIETGIDIPNANTLIIENADRMGLAQLHQIRGRVGRSYRRAYAYFTYRRGKEISEIASRRLSAIRDFARFGAGFKIAMKDLEIRGAGNLLGAEQHGHLDAIGYDLYIKLLNEAVLEERGELPPPEFETKMIISKDAFLPKSYVKSSSTRMEMYKKIAHIKTFEDMKDTENEMRDRFGPLPEPAKTLLYVAILKAFAQEAEIERVEWQKNEIKLFPKEVNLSHLLELSRIDREHVLISGVGRTPFILIKGLLASEAVKSATDTLHTLCELKRKEV